MYNRIKGRHRQTTALKAWVQRWLLVWVVMAWAIVGWGQTYFDMSSGNYSQNFTNIANTTAWPNGFDGTESQMWRGLAVNTTGTIPSALRITTATNSAFVTGTTGGVQRGSGNIQLLTTGNTDNTSSGGIELYLNFTGRTAGTLGFDAACVFNGGGTDNRVGTLRVYASVDGTTYEELTATGLPFVATNNVVSSASISVALPAIFNNAPNARLRFYYHNGTGGSSGARPKISIDNVLVTSTPSSVNYFWNGGTIAASPANGGTGIWTTTNAWRQPTANGAQATWANGNIANFAGTAGTVTLPFSQSPASTVIATTGYTFATSGASAVTLSGNIGLGGNAISFAPIAAAPLTVSGVISGTGGITHTGAGTTVLSGTNTYSGNTTINAGTLSVGAVANLGTGSTVLNGGTLATTATFNHNKALIISANSTINTATSTTLTYSGAAITGSGGLTKAGAGTLVMPTGQNYTDKTIVSAGTWSTSGESSFGTLPGAFTSDQITFSGGATLLATGNINFSSTRGITLGTGGVVFNSNGNTITVSNVMTGTGAVNKTGTGTLRYDVNSGTHSYTGTTTITAGTLQLERDNDIPDGSNVILAGGTLQTGRSSDGSGRNETAGTIQLTANSTIALGTGAHNLTFAATATAFTAGQTLTITGWTGTPGLSGTGGRIFVGSTASGMLAANLAQIQFSGYALGAVIQLASGEIVPVSSASDIVRSTGFTEPENIAYQNFQAANILGNGINDIKIGEFTIRDGAGASDADALPTILSSITFSVSNPANVRRLALYNGATEVGEQAGAATVTFTGLSLTAPDNGSFTFSVVASFNTAVTDNQQIQLTVTAASVASGSSSGFAAANAGGSATSTTADRNRIEVTATRLVFVQQPTSTTVLTNMSPVVTVAARDAVAFNNTDLDYTTSVTLSLTTTTCGSLTGNTATPASGVASFASLQGTVAETGLTLTATSGALTQAVSGSFNFTNAAAVVTNLVSWNFADQDATADAPSIAANASVTIASTGAAGTLSFPQGQLASPDRCILNTIWSAGGAWTTSNISTIGFQNITVSSVQRGSPTGPRDWALQYNVGSGWVDAGANFTLTSTAWPRSPVAGEFISDYLLPAYCNNISNLQLRWVMTSIVAVNGGAIATGGTNALDEVYVKGTNLSAAASLYYQTTGSGSFENPCVWESSPTGAAPWSQAPAPPDFSAQTIRILNGHSITVNSAPVLDQVIIDEGGTLELNNFAITWSNAPGVDFTINGTYIDNASSAQNSVFQSGARWQLGPNATFIKTRNSSSAVFRDNYEGGMTTIPATANWILRYTGASDVSFTTVAGTFYPNLTFENTTGAAYEFGTTFSGNLDFATIKGNLDIGGTTYPQGVIVRNSNTNATPLTVQGNLIVRAGSTLQNFVGGTSGTGLAVAGNITNNGVLTTNGADGTTGILRLNGTSNQAITGSGTYNLHNVVLENTAGATLGVNIIVPGNLQLQTGALSLASATLGLNGTLTRSTGTLSTTSSSGLALGPNAAALTLPNGVFASAPAALNQLTLNRAGGLTLGNQGITIHGSLTLTDGLLNPNSPLTLTPSATTSGGSTNSFVNGPMHKVANDATDDFAFPIGKSGSPNRYRPVTIADFDGAGELTFTAEYFPTGASTHPRDQILGPELVGVWLNQYWQVSKSPGDLAARVGVPYTSGADGWFEVGPGSNSRVGIARFNGTHWDFTKDANDFDDIGPDYFESRGVGETGMVFSDRLSTFSPFTIGHGLNSILVLPIKLLAFDALQQKNNARLSWQVEDEQLLQGFVLEYSTNGTDFNRVATLQPNGTGHYRYLHALAPGMHHYYRLGMRQHNGTLTYSKVVSLVGAATGTTISAVGPNPMVGHMLTIHSQSATGQWMQATLIDATGRTLATTRYTLAVGVNKNLFTLPALASGYYTLLITTRDGTQVALPLVK